MMPKNLMKLEGKNAGGMLRLSEALEEHDDVQNVYSNFDIDEKEMEALAAITCGSWASIAERERTGYGVIDSDGRAHRLVAAGSSRTSREGAVRDAAAGDSRGLRDVIERASPGCGRGRRSFLCGECQDGSETGARARSGAAGHRRGRAWNWENIRRWKSRPAWSATGGRRKQQVQLMVRSLLRLRMPIESEDACDALAVAICHATQSATRARLQWFEVPGSDGVLSKPGVGVAYQ